MPFAKPLRSTGTLIESPDLLYIQFFERYPEDRCEEVQEPFSLGKYDVMGCTCRGGLLVNVTIGLGNGMTLQNRETLEAFIRQVGVACSGGICARGS